MNDILREKLKTLPDQPGCYLMKDQAGNIIYVGKAVRLKNRVRSYFHGSHDHKTELLVENIVDFETVVVGSEAEALILEANLIKRHMPHYNILLRDDKHYPYLRLTLEEDYPRFLIARRARQDGSRYFGPYPDAGAMHRVVELIRSIFPLRTCGANFNFNWRVCLNVHIGRCAAPCEGRISREEYAKMVSGVADFLQGRAKDIVNRERELMEQAAEELRFEDAARHRDTLEALKQVQQKQQIDLHSGAGSYDVVATAVAEDTAVVQVFFVRGGNVVSREHFLFTGVGDSRETADAACDASPDLALLLLRFIQDYYGGGQFLPSALYCNRLPEDAAALAGMLAAQCGHKVEISVPQRGDKRRLLGLVEENARLVLENYLGSRRRRGAVIATGTPEEIAACESSFTGQYLKKVLPQA